MAMEVLVEGVRELRFDDGTPVRAASAVAELGHGWLVVQDDATHAAWRLGESTTPVRVFPPVQGLEEFSEAAGTKHLKPDLEAACPVQVDGEPAVLLLGSGSTPARMRGVLVRLDEAGRPYAAIHDLSALYGLVSQRLGLPVEQLNLEGACVLEPAQGQAQTTVLRWFQRGNLRAGIPSGSVDVTVSALLNALDRGDVTQVPVDNPLQYDLGAVDGVGLAVTDAVSLPDGRVLLSVAAEDTLNAVDDGPVVATAVALLECEQVLGVADIPLSGTGPYKVEGLALRAAGDNQLLLLGVVDADDPDLPSVQLDLRIRLH